MARHKSTLRRESRAIGLFLISSTAGDFQNRQESLLGDVHAADALHAFFAFFLFFEEFAFAGDVTAVAFGDHVLADGADGFAGDHTAADGGLYGDFEHLARDEFAQAAHQIATAFVGLVAVADYRERVHRLAAHQHVQLHQVRFV